jgi:hypothetical protein
MTRQLIEHMIKKTHASRNIGNAGPIEVETDLDARLLRLAYDCALAHGVFFASSRFGQGDSKPRADWPLKLRHDRAERDRAGFRNRATFD